MPAVSHPPARLTGARGFTLTELAVVLVIVALVVGSLLVPLSAQIDIRNTADTRASLAEIREALLGFVAANGRLPCPAAASVATGVGNAGSEQGPPVNGVCRDLNGNPTEVGVLPWVTLGVRETDAWGRRYTYRVSTQFAQSVPPPATVWPVPCTVSAVNAAFVLCASGTLVVRSAAAPAGSAIALQVPVVVISHGKNGNGAFTPLGTQLPAGADADEQDNQLTNAGLNMANSEFVSKTPTTTFDDELLWISRLVVFNRLITVGKLP
ncbi:MAG: prepilin-type N-terminal cleavage/methylation domain-containing protein [Candidatus Accumulibacter sp.]|nr:prepilin-type N-terminal cleavage/methylation domain-containing protein [Accumulibacter sp.]